MATETANIGQMRKRGCQFSVECIDPPVHVHMSYQQRSKSGYIISHRAASRMHDHWEFISPR